MNRLGLPLASLFSIIFLLCLSGFALAEENSEIKIGAIASLTGPAGEQGKNWLEGARLAADELYSTGLRVKLIIEDDCTNPSKVAAAFHKLAAGDKVRGIIGGTWDYLAEAAYPIAKQYKIPFVTPTNPVEILSETAVKNPWIFTNGLSLEAEGRVISEFLDTILIKSAGLVYINVPFGTSHAEMFRSLAERKGIKIAADSILTFEGFSETIKLAALKMKHQKPELVYLITDYNGIDLFTRELASLKSAPIILTTQHLDKAFEISDNPGRYRRLYGVYPEYRHNKFDQAFQRKFGAFPRVYAAEGYDALIFLAKALQKNIEFSEPSTVFTYNGLTGKYRLPSKKRALVDNQAVIMTTSSGVFKKYILPISGEK
jgi:branched-chain amino acid transport system substrate-binding protein